MTVERMAVVVPNVKSYFHKQNYQRMEARSSVGLAEMAIDLAMN